VFLTLRNKKIEVLEKEVPGEYLDKRKIKWKKAEHSA
jgi:hypothetical protein